MCVVTISIIKGGFGMDMGGGEARATEGGVEGGAQKVIIVDSINIPSEAGGSSSNSKK